MADSGVFMLMGIKLILQRKPHLSEGVARRLNQSFRACVFIELLCHKVKPTSADLRDINLAQVVETGTLYSAPDQISHGHQLTDGQESSFFEDAMAATISAAQAISSASPIICQAEEASASLRNLELPPVTSPDSPPTVSSLQPQPQANMSRKRMSQPRATKERAEGRVHQDLDDRKIILDNLSHAIHFKRSALVAFEDNPSVLWKLVQYSRTSGNLHRRFHAVLFHKMMEDTNRRRKMKSSMMERANETNEKDVSERLKRDLRSWKFWKRVSDTGVKHKLGPFVPLCAFGNDFSGYRLPKNAQDLLIEEFENRLQNATDRLRIWLQDARALCEAILVGPTPVSLFNIDDYNFQAEFDMNDDQFRSYVCFDSAQGSARQRIQ
ncbi:hypothetical protein FBEOM_7074 [Fusarium beomiforme]|uniref:Uncharacterized protein n=1 Tax=Fusarium beomiforme TaxID=44412 RepID=A0A9P5AHX9_9HYPO|nr:hypothetical protein FBEOM_7074 [Fusarium beomiforme]